MDEKKTWTIVQFLQDFTVEAIPSTWILGNDCHWPPFTSDKLINAIKKSVPLDASWPTHKIKIFRNATYGDYLTARQKAKIAENTSDINSDSEVIKKRKRIMKNFSSSDEEDPRTLSQPSEVTKYKKIDEEPINEKNGSSTNNIYGVMETDQNFSSSDEDPSTLPQPPTITNYQKRDKEPRNEQYEMPTIHKKISPTCKNCRCKTCMERDTALKNLSKQYHILRGIASDTLEEVKAIRKSLNRSEPILAEGSTSFFSEVGVQFPLNSEDDLKSFEEYLNDRGNFQKAVAEVSKVGGRCLNDFLARSMQLVFTNDLALGYSWLGRKGKKVFKNLKVANLIIEAGSTARTDTSKIELEKTIQLWIRRAYDRKKYIENKKS